METVTLDPERQKQAKIYARIQRRWEIAGLALGLAYILVWLIFGFATGLRTTLNGWAPNFYIQVALFALIFGGIFLLINLPMDYYTGFVLPHRFGQSTETLRGWVGDQIKGMLVSAPLGLILLEIVYILLRAAPQTWWLWVAGVMLLFTVVMANLAPILIMPLFYKVVPLGEEHAELAERLLALARKAQTKVRGVFKFDMSRRTKSANAALTGLGNTRRIILGDTLISEFTPDEIETVLAHELGHHVHKDIPVGIVIESVVTLVGLYLASLVLNWGVNQFGLQSPSDPDYHAVEQCLFPLARAARRSVCSRIDRPGPGIRLGSYPAGQPESGRRRPRTVGRMALLFPSRVEQTHPHGGKSSKGNNVNSG
jgi:STE24 endopeptidase